ncbi:MAG: hypothetical protein KAI24_24265 [Planctomycetes bacterium]|nr:hypothetical protein [Planctomycetota bacterium]
MQHEVRSIPPAPRRVRLRPLLAHRWPLFAIGGPLVVFGSLIAWAMFLQSGGKFSLGPLLDAGPTLLANGEVTKVLDSVEFDDRPWNDIRYRFDYRGSTLYGGSFVAAGSYAVGDPVQVELLEQDPNVNRAIGGTLHIDRRWLYAQFWIVALVTPGALILLGWLTGVFQLRQVLAHGDVSVGTVTDVRKVRYVLPEMLRVTYEFRDHRARLRKNRHWVRARGALGTRLQSWSSSARREALPVLHDRRLPHWNRLLLPEDFLATDDHDRDLKDLLPRD